MTVDYGIAHKHLVAENCVNAQFCVNDYTKLRQALILRHASIFSHQMFMCIILFQERSHWQPVYIFNQISKITI